DSIAAFEWTTCISPNAILQQLQSSSQHNAGYVVALGARSTRADRSNPRHRAHLARKEVVHRDRPLRHPLVVRVTAERLDRRAARLDAVRIGVRSAARDDLLGDRRRPRQRTARAREVAEPVDATAL